MDADRLAKYLLYSMPNYWMKKYNIIKRSLLTLLSLLLFYLKLANNNINNNNASRERCITLYCKKHTDICKQDLRDKKTSILKYRSSLQQMWTIKIKRETKSEEDGIFEKAKLQKER